MGLVSTGDSRVAYMKSCVVYDAGGEIRHVHTVVDMDGVQETSENTVSERALAMAGERGLDTSDLRTLLVDPARISGAVRMRVDTATGTLQTLESSTL
jgi:hypothetical protein